MRGRAAKILDAQVLFGRELVLLKRVAGRRCVERARRNSCGWPIDRHRPESFVQRVQRRGHSSLRVVKADARNFWDLIGLCRDEYPHFVVDSAVTVAPDLAEGLHL